MIVNLFVDRFKRREDNSNVKSVEVQLDCLEYFLSTIPESLLEEIGPLCLSLIVCSMMQWRQISDKAKEILSFINEILTADLVLPHSIVAIDNEKTTSADFSKQTYQMQYLAGLVKDAESLDEPAQFTAVI